MFGWSVGCCCGLHPAAGLRLCNQAVRLEGLEQPPQRLLHMKTWHMKTAAVLLGYLISFNLKGVQTNYYRCQLWNVIASWWEHDETLYCSLFLTIRFIIGYMCRCIFVHIFFFNFATLYWFSRFMIDCKAVKNVEIFSWQLIPNVAVAVADCDAAYSKCACSLMQLYSHHSVSNKVL